MYMAGVNLNFIIYMYISGVNWNLIIYMYISGVNWNLIIYMYIPGVDPKSILCQFFKQGQCSKGDKCKFSHDLNIARKSEKKNLYADVREDEGTL